MVCLLSTGGVLERVYVNPATKQHTMLKSPHKYKCAEFALFFALLPETGCYSRRYNFWTTILPNKNTTNTQQHWPLCCCRFLMHAVGRNDCWTTWWESEAFSPMVRLNRQLSCRCRADSLPRDDDSYMECSRSMLWSTHSSCSFPCAGEPTGLRLALCCTMRGIPREFLMVKGAFSFSE